ncbi:MAG TPA: Hpt domain-containing protein, partial [Gemmatimonadaceae bacterium]
MDLSRYADLFQTESREHLSAMNASLLELERAPERQEPIDAIFRAVHTVKGMSATMGFVAVTELAHELETLLDRVRSGHQLVTPAVVDLFFRAADALETAIEQTVQGRDGEIDVGAMVTQLKGFTESARASEPIVLLGEPMMPVDEPVVSLGEPIVPVAGSFVPIGEPGAADADDGCTVRVRLAPGTALPAARAMLVVKHAETLGRVLSVSPPIETLVTEGVDGEFSLRLDTAASLERIQEVLLAVGDVEHVEVMDGGGVHPEIAAPAAPTADAPGQDAAPMASVSQTSSTPSTSPAARSASRYVRIDSRRLDAL